MVKFMKKVTKLALKSAAICTGIAAGVAVLHKYVKIQSNCSGCGPKEDNFDEDLEDENLEGEDIKETETADTKETEEDDAISSDDATDSSSRRYINIHVTGQNSDVDISIDKGQLFDDAAKLVADAAHLTKSLRPGSHNADEKEDADEENEDSHFSFEDMDANNDIADLDIEDLGVDIDEDLSEGVSDLYAMDCVEEGAEESVEEDAKNEEAKNDDEDAEPNAEENKEEAPVNSSIHL